MVNINFNYKMAKNSNISIYGNLGQITVSEALSLLRKISGDAQNILTIDGKLIINLDQHRAVQAHFRQKIDGLESAIGAIPSIADPEYKPIHDEYVDGLHGHIRDIRILRNAYLAFYEVDS